MIYHITCEVLPGREKELDSFLSGKMKSYWVGNPGIVRYRVYGDHLANKLERVIMIEVGSFHDLDTILAMDERKELRSELVALASNVQSRILEPIVP